MAMHVVVGLSGGVDSAVTAALLKEQGYRVTGVYMTNWHEEEGSEYCHAQQDLADAQGVSEQLGIDFKVVDLAQSYYDHVFERCLELLALGYTPNPDVLCNRHIKFDAFLEVAQSLGAQALATGHYAAIRAHHNGRYSLWRAQDKHKDQSYFLCWLNQKQLAFSLFPLATWTKDRVREKAKALGLLNATKRDSVGICFIGKRPFARFISDYMLDKPGPICTLDGAVLGRHRGLMYFTLGQRQGLNLGGLKQHLALPWYVVAKDVARRTLVVAQGGEHPALYKKKVLLESMHWIDQAPDRQQDLMVKIRYCQQPVACTLQQSAKECQVVFQVAQRAVTPGQLAVFYRDNQCLGGGVIAME
jgi:tRNA-uridine 2-sulfurtransferase